MASDLSCLGAESRNLELLEIRQMVLLAAILHPSLHPCSFPHNFIVMWLWLGRVTCFHQQNEVEVTRYQFQASVSIEGPHAFLPILLHLCKDRLRLACWEVIDTWSKAKCPSHPSQEQARLANSCPQTYEQTKLRRAIQPGPP